MSVTSRGAVVRIITGRGNRSEGAAVLRPLVAQLLDGRTMDEQRVAQEIALLAERLDITEELVRLDAHLGACAEALTEARHTAPILSRAIAEL